MNKSINVHYMISIFNNAYVRKIDCIIQQLYVNQWIVCLIIFYFSVIIFLNVPNII